MVLGLPEMLLQDEVQVLVECGDRVGGPISLLLLLLAGERQSDRHVLFAHSLSQSALDLRPCP